MSQKLHKSKLSLPELMDKFDSDDKCREFMYQVRFGNNFTCPFCGSSECGKIKTRNLYRCKTCRKQISPTSGTFMHGTHVKLRLWILAAYLFMTDKGGCSAVYLMKTLKVTYKTAWFILHRFRKAMKNCEEKRLLKGVVEFDDTTVGSPTHGKKRGRGSEKMKVMVAVSLTDARKPCCVKMAVVENLKGITVGKFALKNIEVGSRIESDNAPSYKKPLADKYFHHFKTFSPEDDDLHWLHILISNMKEVIDGTYHRLEKKHADLYLSEYCYRFNHRSSAEFGFECLLASMVR